MSPEIAITAFDSLTAEQEKVQQGKYQGRLLPEYNGYIFSGQNWLKPLSSPVTDLLRPYCTTERVSLEGVLEGMYELNGQQPVRWVDMGGGRGLAMRQLANDPDKRTLFSMTNVDLRNYGLDGLEENELDFLELKHCGITDQATEPVFITADVESVQLPEPADVITSVEVVQYLDNPLAALANWYNQLSDTGVLLVSAEHDWAGWIRYEMDPVQDGDEHAPTADLLEALNQAGVAHAIAYESDWDCGIRPQQHPNRFRTLAIQKIPGTRMIVHGAVQKIWTSPHDFKAVYYKKPEADSLPIVEISADPRSKNS